MARMTEEDVMKKAVLDSLKQMDRSKAAVSEFDRRAIVKWLA